jgi:formylglycine-generating enzyme required for sulfatase activity
MSKTVTVSRGVRQAVVSLLVLWPIASGVLAQDGRKPREVFRDCAECPELVVIPAGTFMMGAPDGEPERQDAEGPQRRVSIRTFAAGRFDLTRGQWAAFVEATNRRVPDGCAVPRPEGYGFDPAASWRNVRFAQDDSHPVVCVTWADAQDYVRWLSQRTGHTYRLLTEAEWEYAARAGTTTAFPWGTSASHEFANYGAEEHFKGLATGRDKWEFTSPVGSFPPNAFGLYDMQGNVLQWVQDCYASYAGLPADGAAYETSIRLTEGMFPFMAGTESCAYRMARGGDWADPPRMIRSAFRNLAPPPNVTLEAYRSAGVGFRVARTLAEKPRHP